MPQPLTESERRAFEWLYFPRAEFGGIPLILLAEKLQLVDTLLEDIVNHPGEDRPLQVLYQLLQFYCVMVSNRREADVRIKDAAKAARKRLNKESGQTLRGEAVSELKDSFDAHGRVDRHNLAVAIYVRVAEARMIMCGCSEPRWAVTPQAIEDTHEFRLRFSCKKCSGRRSVTVSVEELKKLQSQLK